MNIMDGKYTDGWTTIAPTKPVNINIDRLNETATIQQKKKERREKCIRWTKMEWNKNIRDEKKLKDSQWKFNKQIQHAPCTSAHALIVNISEVNCVVSLQRLVV